MKCTNILPVRIFHCWTWRNFGGKLSPHFQFFKIIFHLPPLKLIAHSDIAKHEKRPWMLHKQGISNLIPGSAHVSIQSTCLCHLLYPMQTVCASGSNFLPQCVEGTSKVLIIRCSKGLFLWGGGGGCRGEILREINGRDHQTSMARISASICSIWSRSLRSSECIGKQYSIAIVHGINNTSSKIIKIQNNELSDRPHKCTFCSRTLHMANDAAESNL